MVYESILEVVYHLSGIVIALLFFIILITLQHENKDAIKARLFLKYGKFKAAFYFACIGSSAYFIGNVAGLYGHESLYWLHDAGEVAYNICIAAFAGVLYSVLKK